MPLPTLQEELPVLVTHQEYPARPDGHQLHHPPQTNAEPPGSDPLSPFPGHPLPAPPINDPLFLTPSTPSLPQSPLLISPAHLNQEKEQ